MRSRRTKTLHICFVDKGSNLHSLERINRTPYGVLAIQHFRHFRSLRSQDTNVDLQHALYRSANFLTSNPRDSVYAVLGLTSAAQEPSLYPNYQVRPEEVYSAFTAFCLNRRDYPFLLHRAGIGWRKRSLRLPSWVPDFSRPIDYEKRLLHTYPRFCEEFRSLWPSPN